MPEARHLAHERRTARALAALLLAGILAIALPLAAETRAARRLARRLTGEDFGEPSRELDELSSNDTTTTTATTTPTPAPPTPAPTPAPPPPPPTGPRTNVDFLVVGVDYNALEQNATLRSGFEDACKSGIAKTVNVAPSAVAVTISQGSVQVAAVISAASASATANIETALITSKAALGTNVVNGVNQVPGISSVVTAPLSVNTVTINTAGVPTQQAACTWDFVGYGYCTIPAGGQRTSIGAWVRAGIEAAKTACCADLACGGFHIDFAYPEEYVLLDVVTTADGKEGTRFQCWQKTSGDTELSAAAALRAPAALALAALAALAA